MVFCSALATNHVWFEVVKRCALGLRERLVIPGFGTVGIPAFRRGLNGYIGELRLTVYL